MVYTKYGVDTSPLPFFKKSKLNVSLNQQSEILYRIVLVCLTILWGWRLILVIIRVIREL